MHCSALGLITGALRAGVIRFATLPFALQMVPILLLTSLLALWRLSAAALKLARHFEWETLAERHLELYRELR